MTEYLSGKATMEEIIFPDEKYENLFFIGAGTLVDGPSELLVNSKAKVEALVEYIEGAYDMLLMDTSPVVLVTDAFLLTDMCDATLYVIRHQYTPKMIVKRIDDNNTINPLHNTAIIFNGVKGRGFFKNSYGHGYGYGYVYGYNTDNKKSKKSILKSLYR